MRYQVIFNNEPDRPAVFIDNVSDIRHEEGRVTFYNDVERPLASFVNISYFPAQESPE